MYIPCADNVLTSDQIDSKFCFSETFERATKEFHFAVKQVRQIDGPGDQGIPDPSFENSLQSGKHLCALNKQGTICS